MFDYSIVEFGSQQGEIVATDEALYICEGDFLWRYENERYEKYLDFWSYSTFFINSEGMFLIRENEAETGSQETIFMDIFDKSIQYPKFNNSLSTSCFVDDTIMKIEIDEGIYVYDKIDGRIIHKVNGDYKLKFSANQENLFVREFSGDIVCLDLDLVEKWRVKNVKKVFSSAEVCPQLFDKILIVNLGENKTPERGDFEIVGINIEDGSVVWEMLIPTSPSSSNFIEGKVYITVNDRMMVVDGSNGEILVNELHGFKGDTHHSIYPITDGLLAISQVDAMVKLFTLDGKRCIQKIMCSESHTVDYFNRPVEFENKLYMGINYANIEMRGVSGALLILSRSGNAENELKIKFPLRPPFYSSVIETSEGEHEHLVTISHDSLDEIILYSKIFLKQIGHQLHSDIDKKKRDKKHNGNLHLIIDSVPIAGGSKKRFQEIAESVERHLNAMRFTAGDNEHPFKVLIELR